MKKICFVSTAILLILAALSACAPAAKNEPIKIGLLVMATGDMANRQYTDLSNFAAKEINDKGGINGRPLEIVAEDEGGSPEKGVLAFTKLADKDNVSLIIGPLLTQVGAAIQPKANEKKVALLSMNTGTLLDPKAGAYYFRYQISDSIGNDILLKYVLTRMPAAGLKMGVIHDKTPFGTSSQATFAVSLKNSGVTAVSTEAFEMGTATFIPYLQRMKEAGANVIYLGTSTGPVMGIIRDLGVMQWRPMVIAGIGFGNRTGYNNSGGAWDGVVYWSMIDFSRKDVIDLGDRVKKELNQTFEGESTVDFYDVVGMAAEVLKKAGSDREAIRSTLENFKYDKTLYGPPGTVAQFSPSSHVAFGLEAHVVNQWNAGGVVSTIFRAK